MKNTLPAYYVGTSRDKTVIDMNERLTEHFTLREMCLSATAISKGLKNVPDGLAVLHLRMLCENVLEPLRRRFGKIRITSGYRSKAVNDAIGGAEQSQHLNGQAADIHVSDPQVGRKMYEFIVHSHEVRYDQCIYEFRKRDGAQWLHVSYNPEQCRRKASMNYIMN